MIKTKPIPLLSDLLKAIEIHRSSIPDEVMDIFDTLQKQTDYYPEEPKPIPSIKVKPLIWTCTRYGHYCKAQNGMGGQYSILEQGENYALSINNSYMARYKTLKIAKKHTNIHHKFLVLALLEPTQ